MSSSILEDYCSDQKSVIKLSNSLTNHAFLDRIKGENIGFINEFVFGTFIGRALLSTDPLVVKNVKDISPRHIEKAIISFAVTDNEQRGKLWEVLESVKTMDSGTRFLSDMYLRKQTKHNMDNQMYDNWQINSCLLGCEDAVVNQCYFNNFTFANCTFDFNYIRGCVFSDCKFYKCTYIGLNHDNEVYHCDIDNANIEPLHDCPIDSIDESTIDEQELMLDILSHYLKVGGRNWRMQMISQLRKEYCQQKLFKSAFAQLVNYGYVITNGDKTFLNDAGFSYYNTNKSKQ